MQYPTFISIALASSLLAACGSDSGGSSNSQEIPVQEPALTSADVATISSDSELNPGSADVELDFVRKQTTVSLPQRSTYGYTTLAISTSDLLGSNFAAGTIQVSNDFAASLNTGDHLILPEADDQYGQLFRITAISGQTLSVEPATLQETLPDLSLALEFNVNDVTGSGASIQAMSLSSAQPLSERQYSTTFIPGIKVDTLMKARDDFHVVYQLTIENGEAITLDMRFASDMDTTTTLTLDRSASTYWYDQKVFTPLFSQDFEISAGGLTIPARVEVTPVLQGMVIANQPVNAQVNGRVVASGELGLQYDDSEFSPVNDFTFNFAGSHNGITTDGSLTAGVNMELKMTISLFGKATDTLRSGAVALSGPGGYVSVGSEMVGVSTYSFNNNQIVSECSNVLALLQTSTAGLDNTLGAALFPQADQSDYRIAIDTASTELWQSECDVPDTGNITGNITDLNGNPIENASIRVTINNIQLASANSDNNGEYTVENLPEGIVTLRITAAGYEAYQRDIQIQGNTVTRLSRSLVLTQEQSTLTGSVNLTAVDAQNPQVHLNNALIALYKGAGQINSAHYIAAYYSGGSYPLSLPLGQYTALISAHGYAPVTRLFEITSTANVSISVPLSQTDSIGQDGDTARIVLTWGSTPNDLDSHLLTDYGHVYFANKLIDGAELDVDDTYRFGPETITINPLSSTTPYRYYVHNYSRLGTFAGAEASVTLYYMGNIRTFYSPAGTGYYWRVFDIENGRLTPCLTDCISNTNPALNGTASIQNVEIKAETESQADRINSEKQFQ